MIDAYTAAQQSIVGALMLEPKQTAARIFDELRDEHFADPTLCNIWRVIKSLWQEDKPIDSVIVLHILGAEYRPLLVEIIDTTPTTANFPEYIEIVKSEYTAHCAKNIISQMQASSIFQNMDELREKSAELLGLLNGGVRARTTTDIATAFNLFMDDLDRKPEYVKFGLRKLDSRIYSEPGDYIVIGSRPSGGKTALALNFCNVFADKYKTVFFSLETNVSKLSARYFSNALNVDFGKIKRREISDEELKKMYEDFKGIGKKQIHFEPAAGMSAADICAVALREKAQIIVIDYIGLVADSGKTDYERVTAVSKYFHTFAQRHGVSVVCLCQFNRDAAKGRPTMASLRESGQIEQDADVILLLHRPDENATKRELIVAKNKEGETGLFDLEFDGTHQRFYEDNGFKTLRGEIAKIVKDAKKSDVMYELPDTSKESITAQQIFK